MLRLRPFRTPDAKIIVTWVKESAEFYKWSAGILGDFPVSEKWLLEATSGRDSNVQYFPMTAFDETGPIGFFTIRTPGEDEVSLDVFASNMQAYYCYKSLGYTETGKQEICEVGGYTWNYIEMVKK